MSKKFLLSTAVLLLSSLSMPVLAADAAKTADDPVVARVNSSEIHRSDIMHEMTLLGPQAQQIPPQMLYSQLLQKMIATKLASTQGFSEKIRT